MRSPPKLQKTKQKNRLSGILEDPANMSYKRNGNKLDTDLKVYITMVLLPSNMHTKSGQHAIDIKWPIHFAIKPLDKLINSVATRFKTVAS